MHKTVVKVIGIGGAGNHALNAMIEAHVSGVEFVALDTDAQALQSSLALRIHIGKRSTKGFDAQGNPEVARRAAIERSEEISWMLYNTDLVFLLAGMGGGTGGGATPVIARLAKKQECLVIAVVTRPFLFEGKRRLVKAERGLRELRKHANTLIVIPNQRLLRNMGKLFLLNDALSASDEVIVKTVQAISDLLLSTGLINLDFAHVETVIGKAGDAFVGIGVGRGDDRAVEAATKALSGTLFEEEFFASAQWVLINITGGPDLTLLDVNEAALVIKNAAHEDAHIIFGTTIHEKMGEEIRVTVIAGQGKEEEPDANRNGGNHPPRT